MSEEPRRVTIYRFVGHNNCYPYYPEDDWSLYAHATTMDELLLLVARRLVESGIDLRRSWQLFSVEGFEHDDRLYSPIPVSATSWSELQFSEDITSKHPDFVDLAKATPVYQRLLAEREEKRRREAEEEKKRREEEAEHRERAVYEKLKARFEGPGT